jgi:hypothetical protein
MGVIGKTAPWRVRAAAATSLLLVGAVGCSSSTPSNPVGTPATSAASSASGPYTGYPDSIAALGHSLITGEGTGDESDWKANSWATGTNPQVNSVYLRLRQVNPAIEGHVHNLGTGGADLAALTEQAQALSQLQPQPELVIIATLDSDITCPASADDFAAYGAGLKNLLNSVSEQMPASRFFITTQTSTPTHDAEIYSLEERARSGGTGPCAFLDLRGRLVPKELMRLETAIAGYKAQVSAACAEVDRCHTDQSGKGWSLKRSDLSDDLNHMNLSGQARWAEHEWTLLEAAQLVPAG